MRLFYEAWVDVFENCSAVRSEMGIVPISSEIQQFIFCSAVRSKLEMQYVNDFLSNGVLRWCNSWQNIYILRIQHLKVGVVEQFIRWCSSTMFIHQSNSSLEQQHSNYSLLRQNLCRFWRHKWMRGKLCHHRRHKFNIVEDNMDQSSNNNE